ncbi:MAG: efflux RND transporter permease subunit, partial [Chitinophagales bacterium]
SEKDRTNILAINQQITPVLDKFEPTLPSNIVFEEGFNQAHDVSKRLSGFARDFGIAIFLVLLTLLPLGWRASVIVMISIPLSLSIGLAILNFFGYTINQLSIVGMVVALGLLVDDSIVVVENIERFLRNGFSRKNAAIEATKQIGLAVVGCTATLIFAFLPIVFLPEGSGDFIRSLPIAVISTVLASLFVSLTIIPFLSSLILSRHHNPEGNIFMRGLKKIISGSYRQLLHRALTHPYITLFIAFAIFVVSLALFPVVGFSLFPKSEKPMFMVNIETPLGTNLYATDKVAQFVEQELKQHSEITSFFTNVGKGNPRIYYNIAPKNESSNYAQLFIRTEPLTVNELETIIDELRHKFNGYPNAKIEVKQFEQGPPIEAPVAMRIFGEDLDTLRSLAFMVEDIMKNTDGTIYITNPLLSQKTDLHVAINKDKAGMLGIPITEIDRTVRLGIAGLNIGTYRDEKGDEHQINVTLPKQGDHPSIDQFDKIYVSSVTGNLIPLKQLATLEMNTSVPTIKHYNKNRYITVTSYVKTGFNTGEVTEEIIEKMDTLHLPTGYSYQAAGEVESSQESFAGLGTIIIITIFGILGILLLEFGTFKSTFIVLSVIPLGVIGAVFTLLLVGKTFSFVAVIGLIALIGIEVKNSILLVDFTNYLRERGMELNKAIEEAGETRFVPIILTTLTAIGGLTPLVLEDAPLYAPLAWVLIGGLISSTLLTRLVTPVLYKLLAPKVVVVEEKV